MFLCIKLYTLKFSIILNIPICIIGLNTGLLLGYYD